MKRKHKSVHSSARGFRFTETGKGILIGSIFTFLACLVIPAFGVFSALVVLQVVALGMGWWFRPRIRIHGSWPEQTTVHETLTGYFTIENQSRFPVYHLLVSVQQWSENLIPVDTDEVLVSLAPGDRVTVSLSVRCSHRGRYPLEQPSCFSSFPFNLYLFGTGPTATQDVLVLPAYQRLPIVTDQFAQIGHDTSGYALQHTGLSPEYIGNRPFQYGDSPRHIDARAWARLAAPAVKEFHNESQHTVSLFLDTWLGQNMGGGLSEEEEERFEAAISLAASLAYSLPSHAALDSLVLGPQVHTLQSTRLDYQVEEVHAQLAVVEPAEKTFTQKDHEKWTQRFHQYNAILWVAINWHTESQKLLNLAQSLGYKVIVFGIKDNNDISISDPTWPQDTQWLSAQAIHQQEVVTW